MLGSESFYNEPFATQVRVNGYAYYPQALANSQWLDGARNWVEYCHSTPGMSRYINQTEGLIVRHYDNDLGIFDGDGFVYQDQIAAMQLGLEAERLLPLDLFSQLNNFSIASQSYGTGDGIDWHTDAYNWLHDGLGTIITLSSGRTTCIEALSGQVVEITSQAGDVLSMPTPPSAMRYGYVLVKHAVFNSSNGTAHTLVTSRSQLGIPEQTLNWALRPNRVLDETPILPLPRVGQSAD